jgi:hypothetical protein
MGGKRTPGPSKRRHHHFQHLDRHVLPRIPVPPPGPIRMEIPVSAEISGSPLIASGPEAIRKAAEILEATRNSPDPNPFPSGFGAIPLKRGMLSDDKNLIIYTDWKTTVYLVGDKLYSLPTSDFVRNIWFNALAEGAKRARHWIPISQVIMAFATGLLVNIGVLIAADAIVLVLWSCNHPDLLKYGWNNLMHAYRALAELKTRYPTLWVKLKSKIEEEFINNFEDALKETVTDPKNIAFFLGRLFHGPATATLGRRVPNMSGDRVGMPPSVPVGKIVKVIVKCAAAVTILDLPAGASKVAEKQLQELAEDLRKSFQGSEIGIDLTEVEARKIATEFQRDSDRKAFFKDLQQSMSDLKDVLEQMESEMKSMKGD